MQPPLSVIVYDVSDDRRRTRLHRLLRQYGVAVQKSAFEARLTQAERRLVLRRASGLIDPRTDRLAIYPLAGRQEERILCAGLPRPSPVAEPWIVV